MESSKLSPEMAKGTTIAVNPSLLVWARKESGYDVEIVAKKLQVKEDKLVAWEAGEEQPTFRQAENLAHVFRRPLSLFFMPRPPQIPPLSAEYRHLSSVEPGNESPELRLALRQMVSRRENALNLMGELGEKIPEFTLRAHLQESPADVGTRLREASGISVESQLGWANEWEAWRNWRSAAENLGILVFQFTKVSLREARGISLLRMPMPVAAINSKEIIDSKAFTLFHEVVHLMLAASNEEVPAIKEKRTGSAWDNIEQFAEIAASHVLVPENVLRQTIAVLDLGRNGWNIENVRKIARRFKITPLATATRLRESGFMDWGQYRQWRAAWDAYVATLPPKQGGFATPEGKAVNRAGVQFAQLVIEALDSNRITAVEASRYLDLKFQHFDKLREYVYSSGRDGAVNE